MLLLLSLFMAQKIMNLKIYFIKYFNMNISIYLSLLSMLFVISLIFIFMNIMSFSLVYMTNQLIYFNLLIMYFVLSMLILLSMNSMIMLMLGWELLGITSYFLVLFYYNWNSFQGSLLTLITNRLGDLFMMVFLMIYKFNNFFLMMIVLFFMSLSKSAQFPFSTWLPAAMAAPTPVSALVHSSTLVTAGIYILYKFNFPLYLMALKKLLIFLGLLTMMLGSFKALISMDMKKIVAYSTLSQLGFLMMLFYSMWSGLVIFHLLVHAFLKSLLFMIMGFLIMKNYSQYINKSNMSMNSFLVMSIFMIVQLNFINGFMSMMFFSKEFSVNMLFINMYSIKLINLFILIFTLVYTKRMFLLMFSFLTSKMLYKYWYNMNVMYYKYYVIFSIFSLIWFMNMFKYLMLFNNLMVLFLLIIIYMYMNLKTSDIFKMLIFLNNMLSYFLKKLSIYKFEESIMLMKYISTMNFKVMMKYNFLFLFMVLLLFM